jgi:hypothetical protein
VVHRKIDDLLISRLDLGLGFQELSGSLLEDEVGSDSAVGYEEHFLLWTKDFKILYIWMYALLGRGKGAKLLEQLALGVRQEGVSELLLGVPALLLSRRVGAQLKFVVNIYQLTRFVKIANRTS